MRGLGRSRLVLAVVVAVVLGCADDEGGSCRSESAARGASVCIVRPQAGSVIERGARLELEVRVPSDVVGARLQLQAADQLGRRALRSVEVVPAEGGTLRLDEEFPVPEDSRAGDVVRLLVILGDGEGSGLANAEVEVRLGQ